MDELEKTRQILLNYREIKEIYDTTDDINQKKQSEQYLNIIKKYLTKLKNDNLYLVKRKYARCRDNDYMVILYDVLCFYYVAPIHNSFAAVTELINKKHNTSYSSATITHFHNTALKIVSEYLKEDDVI